jgi:hypothetical protein
MFTAAECRAKALEKIMQAKQDDTAESLHPAADAWLFLAGKLDHFESFVAVAYELDDDADIDLPDRLETKPSVAAVSPEINDL